MLWLTGGECLPSPAILPLFYWRWLICSFYKLTKKIWFSRWCKCLIKDELTAVFKQLSWCPSEEVILNTEQVLVDFVCYVYSKRDVYHDIIQLRFSMFHAGFKFCWETSHRHWIFSGWRFVAAPIKQNGCGVTPSLRFPILLLTCMDGNCMITNSTFNGPWMHQNQTLRSSLVFVAVEASSVRHVNVLKTILSVFLSVVVSKSVRISNWNSKRAYYVVSSIVCRCRSWRTRNYKDCQSYRFSVEPYGLSTVIKWNNITRSI